MNKYNVRLGFLNGDMIIPDKEHTNKFISNGKEFDLNKDSETICPTCDGTGGLISTVPMVGLEQCYDCSGTKILKVDDEF